MTEKNFMTAGVEISAYADKKVQCLIKVGNILADVCVTKIKSSKGAGSTFNKDVTNLLSEFSKEDQVVILTMALAAVTDSLSSGTVGGKQKAKKNRNDIFGNRPLY